MRNAYLLISLAAFSSHAMEDDLAKKGDRFENFLRDQRVPEEFISSLNANEETRDAIINYLVNSGALVMDEGDDSELEGTGDRGIGYMRRGLDGIIRLANAASDGVTRYGTNLIRLIRVFINNPPPLG